MGKESKEKIDLDYVDFIFDWGLEPEPQLIVPTKGGYLYEMDGTPHFKDYLITWNKILNGKSGIVVFGFTQRQKATWAIRFKDGKPVGDYTDPCPLLFYIAPSIVTHIKFSEYVLPDWCPYPNMEGNLVNNPTLENILRTMMEVDREYGKFLHRKFKNEEIR